MAAEAEQEGRQRRSADISLCACRGVATSHWMSRAVRCAFDRCRYKPAARSPALATQHNSSQGRQLGGQQSMDAALEAHALARARAASWILPWHERVAARPIECTSLLRADTRPRRPQQMGARSARACHVHQAVWACVPFCTPCSSSHEHRLEVPVTTTARWLCTRRVCAPAAS